jgi:hypothetical protein
MKLTAERLQPVFDRLKRHGYFAEQNWKCCQSCGCAAIPSYQDKFVFYHEQDAERMEERDSVYLTWSGDGRLIRDTFRKAGFKVEWDGSEDKRLLIS